MAPSKNLKHTYQLELQTLPIQLVPPDPLQPGSRSKGGTQSAPVTLPAQPDLEREVVDKLISKIKRI